MAFFGPEFIRAPIDARSGEVGVLDLVALDQALSSSQQRMTLYIPPGRHRLLPRPGRVRYGRWEGDLRLGQNVTLWFDDDATLQLENARLVIDGGLVAPASRIFIESGSNALVIFRSMQPALLPEWWGAMGLPEVDDRDAVQRAIEAATVRRLPQGESLPPIPVRFSRMYAISAPIVVGPERDVTLPPPSIGVERFGRFNNTSARLEGLSVGGLAPVGGLRALAGPYRSRPSDPPERHALLHLIGAQRTVVQNLAFDGAGVADFGVIIEGNETIEATGAVSVQQMHSVSVRRCALRGARRVLLQAGAAQRSTSVSVPEPTREVDDAGRGVSITVQVPFEERAQGGGDLLGLYIEENHFVCDADVTPLPRALQLRAQNAVAARVSRCSFRGAASAFIDAPAVMAIVEGCDFENTATPSSQPRVTEAPGFENPDGVDIYLGTDRFRLGSRTGNVVLGYLAVVGCTSRSARFFGTVTPGPVHPKKPERANLILGCQHRPSALSRPETVRSVFWGRLRYEVPLASTRETARLSSDATLSVVGSVLAGGMEVLFGAAQSVLLSSWLGAPPSAAPTFSRSRPGISARTLIFGLQALALLLLVGAAGCDPSASAQRDATAPSDLSASDLSASDLSESDLTASDDLSEWDDAQELATMDSGAAFDASLVLDASSALDAAQGVDAVVPSDVFNPRQSRARCVETPSGDSSIPAPRLIFPMTAMRVTSHRPTLQWSLPPGVTGARVELCRDRCCTQPIASFDAVGDRGRPALALPPGVVFWRARGMVGARVGQETSFTWEFGVRRRDTPEDTAWGTLKDFNGDGFDDIVMGLRHDEGDRYTSVLRIVYGQRIFDPDRFHELRSVSVAKMYPGDFNGDGLADLVVLSPAFAPGEGALTLTTAMGSSLGLRLGSVWIPRQWNCGSPADYNGDGFSDIACERENEGRTLAVYFGSATGLSQSNRQEYSSLAQEPPNWPSSPKAEISADLDQDGYADLLVANRVSNGRVRRYELLRGGAQGLSLTQDRRLRFGDSENLEEFANLVAVSDLNADRVVDFVRESSRALSLFESRYVGQYDVTLDLMESVPGIRVNGYTAPEPRLPDLNGDGRPEVVTTCSGCGYDGDAGTISSFGRVWIHWSQQHGESRVREEISGPADACSRFGFRARAVGDVDGDGYDDLVITDLRANTCADVDLRPRLTLLWGGADPVRRRMLWTLHSVIGGGLSEFESDIE